MRTDLLTPVTFPSDKASVVVGFGPFAARVLLLVQQEFTQRGVPAQRAVFLAFDGAGNCAGAPAPAARCLSRCAIRPVT